MWNQDVKGSDKMWNENEKTKNWVRMEMYLARKGELWGRIDWEGTWQGDGREQDGCGENR